MSDNLPAGLVAALGRAESHPDDPDAKAGIEHIQTHLSHVFRTAGRVYKLHKAVRFGFVDFSRRDQRNDDAVREVVLNRRLAPDVYLGVAPLLPHGEGFHVGPICEGLGDEPSGRAVEHCVVMRRLPEGRDALTLLQNGALDAEHLERLASRLARFHAEQRLGAPAPFSAEEWRARIERPVFECYRELQDPELAEAAERADALTRALLERDGPRFERRRREGRAVDGHGDLHLQHVWLEADAEPIVIDCIAFREDLRRIDAACDVAFLAMDLEYRGRRDLAERFLARYAGEADDHDLYGVLDLFIAYRAAVRAKVAALASRDAELEPVQRRAAAGSARAHLALVLRALQRETPGRVAVLAGTVGVGKSTVAAALAEEVGGVVLSSDRVRKARAGLRPTDHPTTEFEQGMYAEPETRRVYAELARRALTVAGSGRVAILDATYARREQRDALREALRLLAEPPLLIETTADPEVTLRRLREREARGTSVSDAGPSLHERSLRSYQPPDEWPEHDRFRVCTDDAQWRHALEPVAARLSSPKNAA